MQIKKYTAETFNEALKEIKEELGSKAIILETKKIRGGNAFGLFGKEMIEVTASDQNVPKSVLDRYKPKPVAAENSENPGDISQVSNSNVSPAVEGAVPARISAPLENEIFELKRSLNEMMQVALDRENELASVKGVQHDLNEMKSVLFSFMDRGSDLRLKNLHKNLGSVYKTLVANGVEERFAIKLAEESQKKISGRNIQNPSYVKLYAARMFMQVIKIFDFSQVWEKPLILSFVGPTGVGKTTTLAKIAAQARIENPKTEIVMITSDTYRTGAVEQLKQYAGQIKVKFRVVQNFKELNKSLNDFSDADLILIDTPGASQRDSVKISELKHLMSDRKDIHNCLLIPASIKDAEMAEVTKRYGVLGIDSMIFTKLDEAGTYGNIFNHAIRFKLPVSYLTSGQKVPEDFEVASKERLIDLLMNISQDSRAETEQEEVA